jgi:hypothetical protein
MQGWVTNESLFTTETGHPSQDSVDKIEQFNNPGAASLQGILTLKWDGATSLQPICTVQRTLRCIAPRHLTRRKTLRCIAPTHFHSQMGRRYVAPCLSHSQMTRSDVAPWSLNSEKSTERRSAMSFSLSNRTERCSGGSVEFFKNAPPRSFRELHSPYKQQFASLRCRGGLRPPCVTASRALINSNQQLQRSRQPSARYFFLSKSPSIPLSSTRLARPLLPGRTLIRRLKGIYSRVRFPPPPPTLCLSRYLDYSRIQIAKVRTISKNISDIFRQCPREFSAIISGLTGPPPLHTHPGSIRYYQASSIYADLR